MTAFQNVSLNKPAGSINSVMDGHLSCFTNRKALVHPEFLNVWNCPGDIPGGNFGFPKIGVMGDSVVGTDVCKVGWRHCRMVLPIKGWDFSSSESDS